MFNIDKVAKSSIARWNRRAEAEAKTPFVIEHLRGYRHPRLMRLGQIHVMDWGDGPRLDYGSGIIYGLSRLEDLRIPTMQDAQAIETAIASVTAAQEAAEKIYLMAFKRGRAPTVEEVRQADAQVRTEVPE